MKGGFAGPKASWAGVSGTVVLAASEEPANKVDAAVPLFALTL